MDVVISVIKIILALAWFLILTLYLTWLERKESAVIQDRIGANRANIWKFRMLGLFQPFADAIKMIFKEDFVPAFANKFLHTLAPFLSFFFVAITICAVPFGDTLRLGGREINLQILDMNAGLLFILAMLSLGIYGIILSGWASRNRFTLLGGIRGAAQLISYEVALGLSLIGIIMVYPSLRLQSIVQFQGENLLGFIPKWGVLLQPLGFVVFFFAALAETKRVPFDMPEGESEIIGFFTEYGGLKWGLFMMTDFMEIIIVSALLTTLFFGGWQVPWLYSDGFHFPWGWEIALPVAAVMILQVGAFFTKTFLIYSFLLFVRWTLPRFRWDQLIRLGWIIMLPLSLINIVVTGLILLLI